jgi:TRAP transporter 4TM/12TM fusion protein
MPPLMGTGIFIMASLANVPLLDILYYSLAPAILYFAALYFYTDIKAAKHGFVGLPRDQLPRLGQVLLHGGHIFIPIVALIALLVLQYTPYFASAACVVLTILVSYLRASTRMTPTKLAVALEAGTRIALSIAALIVSAAVIYAVMVHTGLLNKVTSIVVSYSGGYSAVAIVLIGLLSYVVGMGLPVTASYVIIAALGAGALQEMGIAVLAAHLIIFWFAQDSTITPPICMTAFVGARIAGAPPMRTGWECMKIAKALYIIPFMFAYSSFLDPSAVEIAYDFVLALLMFALLASAIDGYWRWPLGLFSRFGLLVSSGLLFAATFGSWRDSGYWAAAAVAGLALTLLLSLSDRRASLQPT